MTKNSEKTPNQPIILTSNKTKAIVKKETSGKPTRQKKCSLVKAELVKTEAEDV